MATSLKTTTNSPPNTTQIPPIEQTNKQTQNNETTLTQFISILKLLVSSNQDNAKSQTN